MPMTKYRVWLPEQERIIEAESEDEAQELFQERDDIFDFLEVEPAAEPAPAHTEPDELPDWV